MKRKKPSKPLQKRKGARSSSPRKRNAPAAPRAAVAMSKRIEQVNPRELKAYANNAKAHSLEQIEAVAQSIKRFGFNAPILTDATGTLVAGHCRLAAAMKLGLELVPIIRLDHMSDDERRAYIIADNRLGEVGVDWDKDFLGRELAALKDHEFDLDGIGFTDEELEDLLPDLEAQADELLAANRTSEPHDYEADDDDEDDDDDDTEEIPTERIPSSDHVQPVEPPEILAVRQASIPDLIARGKIIVESTAHADEAALWRRVIVALEFALDKFEAEAAK